MINLGGFRHLEMVLTTHGKPDVARGHKNVDRIVRFLRFC